MNNIIIHIQTKKNLIPNKEHQSNTKYVDFDKKTSYNVYILGHIM